MTHTYKIHGMTCNGCRGHVEQTLSEVKGVSNAAVNLEKGEAVIEMKKHIPLKVFEKALEDDGGSYSISMPGESPLPTSPKERSPKTSEDKSEKSPLRGLGTFIAQCTVTAKKPMINPAIAPFVEWIWWPRQKIQAIRQPNILVQCIQRS